MFRDSILMDEGLALRSFCFIFSKKGNIKTDKINGMHYKIQKTCIST